MLYINIQVQVMKEFKDKTNKRSISKKQEELTELAYAIYLSGKTLQEVVEILELNISDEALRRRFKRRYDRFNQDYPKARKLKKRRLFNIINVIQKEYGSDKDIQKWLLENIVRIGKIEAHSPVKVFTNSQENDLTKKQLCGAGNNPLFEEENYNQYPRYTEPEPELPHYLLEILEENRQEERDIQSFKKIEPIEDNFHRPYGIQISDLHQTLQAYFNNTLDDVDNLLHRLYLPLQQLHPSNSLISVLTMEEVAEALTRLDVVERVVVEESHRLNTLAAYNSHHYLDALISLCPLIKKYLK